MSNRDRGIASGVFDLCIGALLAAMALYGAVQIIKRVWLPLCIGLAVLAILLGIIALLRFRFTRW